MTVTQSLSTLRVTYAKLLEEHGANVALLREREAELQTAQHECHEARDATDKLREERDSIRDKADRHAHRAELAEREVKFLRAMVVSGVRVPNQ